MNPERKLWISYYAQLILGVALYALTGSNSLIQDASLEIAQRTTRKQAIVFFVTTLAAMAATVSLVVVILSYAAGKTLVNSMEASQANLKRERARYYLEKGLPGEPQFFPIDPAYRVQATFSKLVGHPVESADSLEKAATVRFSISGVEAELPVYYYSASLMGGLQNAAEQTLMMPFRDLTNGLETPASGRYIILPIISDTFYIDFNQALLWPCVYPGRGPCRPLRDTPKINAFIRAGQRI